MGIVLVVYATTAVFSDGYHHPDEHFQLIEFAGLKLGWNAPEDLAWEYNAKIRPALQPAVAYGVLGVLRLVGVTVPYGQALALRVLTMLLAICCIRRFVDSFAFTVSEKYRGVYVAASSLLWFLPAVNVRFSSEVWAGLLLLWGVALMYRPTEQTWRTCIATGLLVGGSFECRYQMALAVVGLLAWMLWTKRWCWWQWGAFVGGGLLAVGMGTLLDCWMYGTFVVAPWEYFRVNILQDVASTYGVYPWYYYIVQLLSRPTWLIGSALVFSLGVALVYKAKHPVVWCILPFLLVHSLIPHKELRFLFPLINFAPLLLVWGYEWLTAFVHRNVRCLLLVFFCLVNTGGLLMMTFKPAGNGNVHMLHYIEKHYAGTGKKMYATPLGNPGLESSYLPLRFYGSNRMVWKDYVEEVEKPSMFRSVRLEHCRVVLMKAENERRKLLLRRGFVEEYRSIPLWIEWLNRFYGVYREERELILYSNDEIKTEHC